MITAIILSKDRAAQLHLLLESIARFCPRLFGETIIIQNYSNQYYESGYRKVRSLWPEYTYIDDNGNLTQCMQESFVSAKHPFICGITDDCVITDYVPSNEEIEHTLMYDSDVFTFALRMGLNTIRQNYITGELQPPLTNYEEEDGVIKWKWRGRGMYNSGYPWSFDGHVYRKDELRSITAKANPKSLREWEGKVIAGGLPHAGNKMSSFLQSKCLCLAVNCVSSIPMVNGVFHPQTAWDLNQQYLAGKSIDLDQLDFTNIIGCHDEQRFHFKD